MGSFFLHFIVVACRNAADVQNTMQRGKSFQDLFGKKQMRLTSRGSLQRPSPSPSLVVMRWAGALFSMCGVCVFRILNSKGWGLIMEPDSSSPAPICLTVPHNLPFPSIPSLPLFPPSQFLICCVSLWLWPSFVFLPSISFVSLALPPSRSLRALGLSGSCQESRRAHWCHRHRWGRPGQPACSAPPRGSTLQSVFCHRAVTAEPARKQTRIQFGISTQHLYWCRKDVHTKAQDSNVFGH